MSDVAIGDAVPFLAPSNCRLPRLIDDGHRAPRSLDRRQAWWGGVATAYQGPASRSWRRGGPSDRQRSNPNA